MEWNQRKRATFGSSPTSGNSTNGLYEGPIYPLYTKDTQDLIQTMEKFKCATALELIHVPKTASGHLFGGGTPDIFQGII